MELSVTPTGTVNKVESAHIEPPYQSETVQWKLNNFYMKPLDALSTTQHNTKFLANQGKLLRRVNPFWEGKKPY